MSLSDFLGIFGLVIGVVSFAYAIVQGREMSRFKKYQTGQLRSNLKDCIVVMSQSYRLIVDPVRFGISDPEAVKRIAAIHTTSASLIRSFFHELSEVDKPYDGRKLLEYVTSGIITSKWVWQQAQTFVQGDLGIGVPDLPDDTKDWIAKEDRVDSSA